MSGLLIAFVLVLVVPLFVATWRTSLLGLALQGALMTAIAFRHGLHLSVHALPELVDLVVVRTLLTPALLRHALRLRHAGPRNDVIPPNLLSWTVALALVVAAFRVAAVLVPAEGDPQTLVGVATAGVLLGLLVLATRSSPISEVVGALRVENAVALFELGSLGHRGVGLRLSQSTITLITVVYFARYLRALHGVTGAEPEGESAPAPESGRASL
ncbi:MAG: hypothetical protein IPJ34_40485 [Myxococcales bacterium]|nr:hypothetical protein [Myxococcales bacterium]